MLDNYVGFSVDALLPQILQDLLKDGEEIGSRSGRVKELMHVGISIECPWRREVLTPGRRPSIAAQIAETVWILSGRDDVDWLKNYLPRAPEFSDDGVTWRGSYGPRLRAWPVNDGSGDTIDQLAYLIDLLREAPATRRAVAMIYDPARDSREGKDIPCNNWLSFSSRLGQLDLHVAVRSNDVMWGWSGINTFEWSVLLEIMANLTGLGVGGLHFSTTSFHLYDRHWLQAQKIVQHSKDAVLQVPRPKDSPRFDHRMIGRSIDDLDRTLAEWMLIEYQIRHGNPAKGVVDAFPEPMLQSWLRVLQWWWTGDSTWLAPLAGTALEAATFASVQPRFDRDERPDPVSETAAEPFIDKVIRLHNEKHLAYGDSWCRRGEMLGIMANIARKVDRLDAGYQTSDETRADTAVDLFVYLAKYTAWIRNSGTNDPELANKIMREVASGQYQEWGGAYDTFLVHALTQGLDQLERAVMDNDTVRRAQILGSMLLDAFVLADRWAS